MKAAAAAGETVKDRFNGEEFIFQAAPKRTWQGALKGKGEVKGDLFGTGIRWNVSE